MISSKFLYSTIFFIFLAFSLFIFTVSGLNSVSPVIDDGLNLNSPTSKLPGPVKPYCGKIDVTSYISSKIQFNSNQRITGIKRLEDNNYRYFIITVIDLSSTTTNLWLLDIGADGIFSNDDSVRKIIIFNGIHYNALEVARITRNNYNGFEELFWIERNSSSTAHLTIKSCELPNCFQKTNVANLNPINGYTIWTSSNFNLLPVEYGVYLVLHNNMNQMKELSYCSSIPHDSNWCGNPANLYSVIYSTNSISKISGIKNEGVAFLDNSSKKFFNINLGRLIALPSGSVIDSFIKGTISFNNNSYNYILFAEEKISQTDLSILDPTSGNGFYLDKIDNSTNLRPLFLDSRARSFPIAIYNKLEGGNYKTLKKSSLGSNPLVIFEDTNNWEPGDSFVTSDAKVYLYSRPDQKIYAYECNN